MDNFTHDDFSLLQRYMDRELEPDEATEVEKRLAEDTSFRATWQSLLLARQAVKENALREKVAVVHNQVFDKDKNKLHAISRRRTIVRFSLAIAAIFLIAIGVFLYNFFTLSSEKLYSSYFVRYEQGSLRDGENEESPILHAFRLQDYKEVTVLFEANTRASMQDLLLAGISYLETGETPKAKEIFQDVISRDESPDLVSSAEYYLALSNLRLNNFDPALEGFSKIHSDPSHPYYQEVTSSLLRKIRLLRWRN